MSTFQQCDNLTDAVPLFPRRSLYLKPLAKLLISVELPHFKKLIGKSVSTFEVIDKLKELIKPYEFVHTKVVTSTVSEIEFEVEADVKSKVKDILRKTDGKVLKLKNFKDPCKIRASECKNDFPTEEEWNHFFSHSKEMDEAKPGERPDTIHISGLPISWFSRATDDKHPSERLFSELFQQFGKIRTVDIPICDPYRSKMKKYLTGMINYNFGENKFFEGYVQFYDYSGFVKTMNSFRGMKLLHKKGNTAEAVDIKVDFDKSKHLSLGFIKRREIICERLRQKEIEQKTEKRKEIRSFINVPSQQTNPGPTVIGNDKEARKKLREERRKAKLLNKLKDTNSDEMDEKIAREEYKILKAQRMLESIRLIEALFRRLRNIDLSNKNIHAIIKEKRMLMRTAAVTWSEDESSSSSSEPEEHESPDTSASSTTFNRYGWYPPPFMSGAYLPPNHRLLNYPLLQQEEYVKYFSKFLYNRNGRSRGRRRYFKPRSSPYRRYSRSRSRKRSLSKSHRRRSRSGGRKSRGRSWSTSSDSNSSSRSSSRHRRSNSKSRRS